MITLSNKDNILAKYKRLKTITTIISICRLVIAIGLLVSLIILFSYPSTLLVVLSVSLFVCFLVVVLTTNNVYTSYSKLSNLLDVYKSHEDRRELKIEHFKDNGSEFLSKDNHIAFDLDLFGQKSLYQYLNISRTTLGRLKVKRALLNEELHDMEYNDGVVELAVREDTLEFEASLIPFSKSLKGVSALNMTSNVTDEFKLKLKHFIPLISLISTIIYFILFLTLGINPIPLAALLALNIASCYFFIDVDIFHTPTSKYYALSHAYLDTAGLVINNTYDSKVLKGLQDGIKSEYNNLRILSKIYSTLALRGNIIFRVLFNGLFAFDFILLIYFAIKRRKMTNIDVLFDNIALLECMASLAIVGLDNEVYSGHLESNQIEATEMYHPLVKGCVGNSIVMNGGIVLTGSNMSGKTTFMRTLAVNQILFNAGGITFAKEFKSSQMPVLTSLRANDMLTEGISTFYAEIIRMKNMNEALKSRRCLLLVDEIFKGTNAHDRIEGSIAVINKFNSYNQLFIISTHDFELCDCDNISNYHFTEEYNGDLISFDYKIKKGKCETTNALYLLKLANILE